jgi:hypothetical protein
MKKGWCLLWGKGEQYEGLLYCSSDMIATAPAAPTISVVDSEESIYRLAACFNIYRV